MLVSEARQEQIVKRVRDECPFEFALIEERHSPKRRVLTILTVGDAPYLPNPQINGETWAADHQHSTEAVLSREITIGRQHHLIFQIAGSRHLTGDPKRSAALIEKASARLLEPAPSISKKALESLVSRAYRLFDEVDLAGDELGTERLVLSLFSRACIDAILAVNRAWVARNDKLMSHLESVDGRAAALIRQCIQGDGEHAKVVACELIQMLEGLSGMKKGSVIGGAAPSKPAAGDPRVLAAFKGYTLYERPDVIAKTGLFA